MERTAAARFGAAAFWIAAGTMHFAIPRQYEAIVPPRIARWKKEVVVALHPEQFPKIPAAALWARLPVQGIFGLLTWRGTR